MNTGAAYHKFDTCGKTHTPDKFGMLCAVQSRDLNAICSKMENVFEQFIEVPNRVDIKQIMRSHNAIGTCMSGSGPTVLGIFNTKDDVESTVDEFKK